MHFSEDQLNSYTNVERSTPTEILAFELRQLGCRVETNGSLVRVSLNDQTIYNLDSETSFTSLTAFRLFKNKSRTRWAFEDAGISVPEGRTFSKSKRAEAKSYVARLGRVVIKPADGNMGRGASVDVSVGDFDLAWTEAAQSTRRGVRIEAFIEGAQEARYCVVDGECVGVLLRLPPEIMGDGKSTIKKLIEARNAKKAANPARSNHIIRMDKHRLNLLERRGLGLSSVLKNGQKLILDPKGGLSTGGDAFEITKSARSDFKRIAESVAKIAHGADVIGVDMLARDHTDALSGDTYYVIEANTRPGTRGHQFPDFGEPNNIVRLIADHCVKKMGGLSLAPESALSNPKTTQSSSRLLLANDVSEKFTLVFGGDTSLGDSYIARMDRPEITQRMKTAPESFFENLMPLISDKDHFTLNFEGVLSSGASDPWNGKKKYLGQENPERTVSVLKTIGVDSVSLANNHTMDFGAEHLLQTMQHLNDASISTFGAGHNRKRSSLPLTLPTDIGNIHILSGFEYRRRYNEDFRYYSSGSRPGTQRFRQSSNNQLADKIKQFRKSDPNSFIIAFPHWGGTQNYTWANEKMFVLNTSFLKAGADLVLGHGSHMMQQCWVEDRDTTIFSLGNFAFNSPGRYKKLKAPPYSMVARLDLQSVEGRWATRLRLYPIVSDNIATNFFPRPVNEQEANDVFGILQRQGQRIFSQEFSLGQDHRGYFVERTGPVSRRCNALS
jgi:poly-gamma-glutamate capsule biosynthesis protein CapA/YwtB (metallophosphatase superfamily)/D-alanine-D-alanine ligase-like ATP-grasp enzyme